MLLMPLTAPPLGADQQNQVPQSTAVQEALTPKEKFPSEENNVTWPFQTEIFHFNLFESIESITSDDYLSAMAYRVSRKAQVTKCKCEIAFRKAHPRSIPRLMPGKCKKDRPKNLANRVILHPLHNLWNYARLVFV